MTSRRLWKRRSAGGEVRLPRFSWAQSENDVLFNSPEFLLQFLPLVFLGFVLLCLAKLHRFVIPWLTVTSLVFYSWWSLANLPVLLLSIAFNYSLGMVLMRRPSRALLAFGIMANVLLLGIFKYSGFLAQTIRDLSGAELAAPNIVLPLAISFFTFQQIAYLVAAHDGGVTDRRFINYCLFVTFFPQLIAGPITQPREMFSQLNGRFQPRLSFVAIGLTIFLIGLFKKVIVADPFGAYATPIFEAARANGLQAFEAWSGALSYALQMYFDFSGYSDMAIGLGLLFGISMPLNFNSPYKARNMMDYWARWHITLTRFLTSHIYNPIVLSFTRRRAAKGLPLPKRGIMTAGTFASLVALPTLFTMLVAGVWHGAGWQFVVFGLLHGLFLVIAHAWRLWKVRRGVPLDSNNPLRIAGAVLLTFLCTTIALVFFRADSVGTALNVIRGMAGLNGVTIPSQAERVPGVVEMAQILGMSIGNLELYNPWNTVRIVIFLGVVWGLPNIYLWLRDYPTALNFDARPGWTERHLVFTRWRPAPVYGVVVGAFCVLALLSSLSEAPSEFLYFQF